MECMKCGRETDQSFCESCREKMKDYPIKPNTVVQILNRDQLVPKKAPRKIQITPEEKNRILRRKITRLRWINSILAAMILILCMAVYILINRRTGPLPGQNYSTKPTETVTETVTEAENP